MLLELQPRHFVIHVYKNVNHTNGLTSIEVVFTQTLSRLGGQQIIHQIYLKSNDVISI